MSLEDTVAAHAPTKRAIALAGGGPACGLQIGALKAFAERDVHFRVWALSCIGAWMGVIYNQFDQPSDDVFDHALAAQQTEDFVRDVIFRDDQSYDRFPINHVFAPDLGRNLSALAKFTADPESYRNLYIPGAMLEQMQRNLGFAVDRERWNQGDLNALVLENLAAHPLSRFLVSLLYRSDINGLSRIYYEKSSFLRSLDFANLMKPNRPFLYHNAWNITKCRLEQFGNFRADGFGELTPETLCACSALPYIEETVTINGDVYCEGALVDTVNFKQLLEYFHGLDEVWIVRIVDKEQIREPRNLADGLGNLCMLFAASVGADDVKLFVKHVLEDDVWHGKIFEIPVSANITFDWNHSNLDAGIEAGHRATLNALDAYAAGRLEDLRTREKREHERLHKRPVSLV